jgi:hypothetical protein
LSATEHALLVEVLNEALENYQDTFNDDPDPETGAFIIDLRELSESCQRFESVS